MRTRHIVPRLNEVVALVPVAQRRKNLDVRGDH